MNDLDHFLIKVYQSSNKEFSIFCACCLMKMQIIRNADKTVLKCFLSISGTKLHCCRKFSQGRIPSWSVQRVIFPIFQMIFFFQLQWLKLDDLFEQERNIRVSMANRVGVLGLMLHQTVDHDPMNPIRPPTMEQHPNRQLNEALVQLHMFMFMLQCDDALYEWAPSYF